MERVWFRNPNRIAGEIGEVGHLFVSWSRVDLNKSKTDPKAFGNLHGGTSSGWQGLTGYVQAHLGDTRLSNAVAFLVGQKAMVQGVSDELTRRGLPASAIHLNF